MTQKTRHCQCRQSFGRFLPNGKLRYSGPAVVLGIHEKDVQIMIGPPADTTAYVVHKVAVVDPVAPGRTPASTVEHVSELKEAFRGAVKQARKAKNRAR